jgi:hypothetical protein
MPNGTVGDHPFTDIVSHGKTVYSAKASALIREVASLADDKTRRELADLLFTRYSVSSSPNVAELEQVLTEQRDKLLADARARGFEIDNL